MGLPTCYYAACWSTELASKLSFLRVQIPGQLEHFLEAAPAATTVEGGTNAG